MAIAEKTNWRRIAGDLAQTVMHTVKEHDYHQCSNWQEPLGRWSLAERHSPSKGEQRFSITSHDYKTTWTTPADLTGPFAGELKPDLDEPCMFPRCGQPLLAHARLSLTPVKNSTRPPQGEEPGRKLGVWLVEAK